MGRKVGRGVYTYDAGGELDLQILPLPSDASAQRAWDDTLDWFYDEQRRGIFDNFAEARTVGVPPYEIFLAQQGGDGIPDPTGSYFIEIITMHGNCHVFATERDVLSTGAAAARLAISRARELIDHLRRPRARLRGVRPSQARAEGR